MKCKCSNGKCDRPLCGCALFSTTVAKDPIYCPETGKTISFEASKRLKQVVSEGYEVHIVSSRLKAGFGENALGDKCLFDLIPRSRFWTPDDNIKRIGGNDCPALIDLWERILSHLGIEVPERSEERPALGRGGWTELRDIAKEAGAITY